MKKKTKKVRYSEMVVLKSLGSKSVTLSDSLYAMNQYMLRKKHTKKLISDHTSKKSQKK